MILPKNIYQNDVISQKTNMRNSSFSIVFIVFFSLCIPKVNRVINLKEKVVLTRHPLGPGCLWIQQHKHHTGSGVAEAGLKVIHLAVSVSQITGFNV